MQIHLRAAGGFTPRPHPQTALHRRGLRLRLLLARRPRLPAALGADELRRAAAGARPQVSAGLILRPLRRRKCEQRREESSIHSKTLQSMMLPLHVAVCAPKAPSIAHLSLIYTVHVFLVCCLLSWPPAKKSSAFSGR